MFRGISAVNLDNKGRMAVPARYRALLQEAQQGQLIVTIDTEQPCLLMYPIADWEVIEQKLNALPSFNPSARRIQRLLMGHATEVSLDSSGRILLPPLLRDYAGLDKDVVLIGQGKKFEIWQQQRWHDQRTGWLAQTNSVDDLPPELQSLSL